MNLDDAIREIARARKRLAEDQGRLARKNARAAVKAAIATALRAMDREFPLVRKERVVRVAMTPLAKKRRERAKRLQTMEITSVEAIALAVAGIKVADTGLTNNNGDKIRNAPRWAVRALRAGVSSTEILRAIRSRSVRARIEAIVRLRSTPARSVA